MSLDTNESSDLLGIWLYFYFYCMFTYTEDKEDTYRDKQANSRRERRGDNRKGNVM